MQDGIWHGRYLDSVGDGSGSNNAAVDGSSEQKVFRIAGDQDQLYSFERMVIRIESVGSPLPSLFCARPALSAGVRFVYHRFGREHDLLAGETIKSNASMERFADQVEHRHGGLATPAVTIVRWSFKKPIVIQSDDMLCMTINDDLSALTWLSVHMQGEAWVER